MKTILIIVNPKAANGQSLKKLRLVKNHLLTLGYTSTEYLTQNSADIEGIKEAIQKNSSITCMVIIGGDGTLNDVVNALPGDCNIHLIILPCGSGNDFSNYLYPGKTITQILDGLVKNKTVKISIGECNGKKFINGLGIGFDGWVAKKANAGASWIPVFFKYKLAIFRGLFTYRSFYTNLGQSLIIAVANAPTYGGGFRVAPGANPSDGLLDLWQIKPIPTLKRPYFLSLIKKGGHANVQGPYSHQTITEITIQCYKPLPAHLDGEYFEAERFEVRMLEEKVGFVV